jgi:hypothetical protein
MPMREPLRVRRSSPDDLGVSTSLRHALMMLVESPDFAVVIGFAGGGIIMTLKLALAYPAALEIMALFAQTG